MNKTRIPYRTGLYGCILNSQGRGDVSFIFGDREDEVEMGPKWQLQLIFERTRVIDGLARTKELRLELGGGGTRGGGKLDMRSSISKATLCIVMLVVANKICDFCKVS